MLYDAGKNSSLPLPLQAVPKYLFHLLKLFVLLPALSWMASQGQLCSFILCLKKKIGARSEPSIEEPVVVPKSSMSVWALKWAVWKPQ